MKVDQISIETPPTEDAASLECGQGCTFRLRQAELRFGEGIGEEQEINRGEEFGET